MPPFRAVDEGCDAPSVGHDTARRAIACPDIPILVTVMPCLYSGEADDAPRTAPSTVTAVAKAKAIDISTPTALIAEATFSPLTFTGEHGRKEAAGKVICRRTLSFFLTAGAGVGAWPAISAWRKGTTCLAAVTPSFSIVSDAAGNA